jgi:glycosyltransferase involved in cell wall biosynthesis
MSSIDKKSVLIDATSLHNIFTGLGQFSYHLVKEFTNRPQREFNFSFLVHPSSKNLVQEFAPKLVEATWLKRHFPRTLLPILFPGYDLWHATAENTRFTHFPKHAAVLLTLHGLHFLDENSPRIIEQKLERLQQLVNKSHALVTVSSYTEVLVRKNLDIGRRPLKVIHHGVGNHHHLVLKRPMSTPGGKFIFSIGNFFERKNFHVLLPFLCQLEGYALVLAGNHKNHYGDYIKKEVHRLELTDRVFFSGEIDDAEKYWLYQHCDAFVFPSLSEGFGIPVIEAMKAGKPVFCSRFGSLPEMGNQHAYFWECFEAEYMRDFFLEKIHGFYCHKENEINSREYADRFSWGKAAESYLSYYAELTG